MYFQIRSLKYGKIISSFTGKYHQYTSRRISLIIYSRKTLTRILYTGGICKTQIYPRFGNLRED